SGAVNLTSGAVTQNQGGSPLSFTNSGTLAIASGHTWTINGGTFTQQTGAVLNGGGMMTFNSVTAANFNENFTLSGLNFNSTTANFPTAVTPSTANAALGLSNATLNGPATLTNPSGQTLTLGNSNDIGPTTVMPVVNAGTLVVHGGNRIYGPPGTLTNTGT